MSAALQSLAVHFDDPPRAPAANGARPDGDAPRAIAATLRAAGIDAPGSLYNEAIELARDGHLGQAASRLQMLICLDPDDADAQLLLARVHAAQSRPAEALARLDAAVAAGAIATAGFRDQLEAAIRSERASEEEHRARLAAREQGEVKALRQEARQLRSETVRLESELMMTTDRERLWKYLAIGSSVIGTGIILAMLFVGRGPAASVDAEVATAAPGVGVSSDALDVAAETPDGGTTPSADPTAAATLAAPTVATTSGTNDAATTTTGTTASTATPKASPATTTTTKSTMAKGGTHVVASGDTLYKLASRYYGDSSQWTRIRDANRGKLKGGIALTLGQTLVIP